VARIAWLDAIRNKESVIGVVWMVGVAERVEIGLEMDVMVPLVDQAVTVACLNQVLFA
jgi:hypothetical protein